MSKLGADTTAEDQEDNDLMDFNWDSEEGEHNFFNIESETPKKEKQENLIKKVKDADVEVPNNDSTDTDDEEDNFTPFSEIDEEGEDKPEKKTEKKPKDVPDTQESNEAPDENDDSDGDNTDDEEEDTKFYTELTSELKEKGIFSSIEIKDGEEVTEEKFFELQEQELDSRVDEVFNTFFDELKQDANAVAMIKYVKAGGKSEDFLRTLSSSPALEFDDTLDTSKESDQKKIAKIYLKSVEKLDDDEITDRIEFLEEKAKLEESAEKWKNKLLSLDKKMKQDILATQEANKEEAKTKADEFKNSLQTTLQSTEAVGVIKFTAEDKKNLVQAITKPTIKVGDNRFITSFQSKLGAIMKSPEKLLALAKIVESDLDLTNIVTSIETKVVQKVKSKLNEAKNTKVLKNAGNGGKSRSLADHFE